MTSEHLKAFAGNSGMLMVEIFMAPDLETDTGVYLCEFSLYNLLLS